MGMEEPYKNEISLGKENDESIKEYEKNNKRMKEEKDEQKNKGKISALKESIKNLFNKENNKTQEVSYGIESDNSIKKYEERASKLAKSYNTFIDNLLGDGFISKEDIIRIDAEIENDFKNGDAHKYNVEEENIENITNSNLSLSEKYTPFIDKKNNWKSGPYFDLKDYVSKATSVLSGEIDNKDVRIKQEKFIYPSRGRTGPSIGDQYKFTGTLDDKKISEEQAEEIFSQYADFQRWRTAKIGLLIAQRKGELYDLELKARIEKINRGDDKSSFGYK